MAFKIGILGLVHDHIWLFYQDDIKEIDDAEITCVADPNRELLEKAQDVFGLSESSVYTSYQEMLEHEDLDACLVFAPSNEHGKLTELCAQKGLHVMVEKPMAASLAEARQMLATMKEKNLRLMINYPIASESVSGLISMVNSGEIGRVWMLRWRMGHKGPETQKMLSSYFCDWLFDPEKNGGGAMADFCTYGAAVLTAILGRPNEVSAMTANCIKTEQQAEDNGIITVKYKQEGKEALAILEGTWSQMAPGSTNCIFGEKGSIVTMPTGGKYYKRMSGEPDWQEITFPDKPEVENKAVKYFVNRVRKNLPFEGMVDPENAILAQEIIQAAYDSVASGKTIQLAGE